MEIRKKYKKDRVALERVNYSDANYRVRIRTVAKSAFLRPARTKSVQMQANQKIEIMKEKTFAKHAVLLPF